ncbi:hypothetical protein [Rhizobium leguminosarum]|uniref:hypothetical protein n=1 Tax=Rhizobium leguminosarum TaxID=384 RepID=UPI002E10C7EC|nr:hypothetical protein U8Q02_38300 [Rhizobium leguminosarum]
MAEASTLTPISVLMDYLRGVESEKDAIAYARSQIDTTFDAKDISFFAVAPFGTGYLWEIHMGGDGHGWIKAVVDNLKSDPEGEFWFPAGGGKIITARMQDGEPLVMVMTEDDSKRIILSGQPALPASAKMKPAVKKGEALFAFGVAMAATSFSFLVGAAVFYGVCANPGATLPPVDVATLPHSQWSLVQSTTVEEVVSKLEMKSGKWSVEKRRNIIDDLDDLRAKGRTIDARNRQPVAAPAPAAAAATPAVSKPAPVQTGVAQPKPADPAAAVIAPNPGQTPTRPNGVQPK